MIDVGLPEATAPDEMEEDTAIATEALDASTMMIALGTDRLPGAQLRTILPLLPVVATMIPTVATILLLLPTLMPMADRHMTDLLVTSLRERGVIRGKGVTRETMSVVDVTGKFILRGRLSSFLGGLSLTRGVR